MQNRFTAPIIKTMHEEQLHPQVRQYHDECRAKTVSAGHSDNAVTIAAILPQYHRMHDEDYGIDLRYWGCAAILSTRSRKDKLLMVRAATPWTPTDTKEVVAKEFQSFLLKFIEDAFMDMEADDE